MQQTHWLLAENYPQLNGENHAIVSEEETAVIYYHKFDSPIQKYQVTAAKNSVELYVSDIQKTA